MGKQIKGRTIEVCMQEKTQVQGYQDQKKALFCQLDQKYVQFFQFLKELHESQGHNRPRLPHLNAFLRSISDSLIYFFNTEKSYSKIELQTSTICLANLFNVLGDQICQLKFQKQFRMKLRRFAMDLQEQTDKKSYNSKIQAILYILVVFIYKERITQLKNIKDFNKSLFSDVTFIRSLLNLTLPKDKKINKFYGTLLIYISTKQNSKRVKELILISIIKNFINIEHEPTLFNLLVYLRSQKNKVKMNLCDIMQGQIFEQLIACYPKYIQHYQSFYILDYLLHLLALFPSLAKKMTSTNFIPFLLQNAAPSNLHHPLHQATIISFVSSTLNYLQPHSKELLLESIVTVKAPNHYITIKLAQLIFDFESSWWHLLKLVEQGYFERLLDIINSNIEQSISVKAALLYADVVKRMISINKAISNYLWFNLQCKLKNVDLKQLEESSHQIQQMLKN